MAPTCACSSRATRCTRTTQIRSQERSRREVQSDALADHAERGSLPYATTRRGARAFVTAYALLRSADRCVVGWSDGRVDVVEPDGTLRRSIEASGKHARSAVTSIAVVQVKGSEASRAARAEIEASGGPRGYKSSSRGDIAKLLAQELPRELQSCADAAAAEASLSKSAEELRAPSQDPFKFAFERRTREMRKNVRSKRCAQERPRSIIQQKRSGT